MTIEPYRYSNGEAHGVEPPKTPGPAQTGRPAPGRAPSRLALTIRRTKTDPNWPSYSKETKRRLVNLDYKEARE